MIRAVGIPGAILMGLGSILGTGVFVSIGVASGIAGTSVILATVLAAAVATFNGLSAAQLAANHPVSGGTYEYGHRYLNPQAGFAAGWMFLCAKSASAATAALGFAGYLLSGLGLTGQGLRIGVAFGITVLLTLAVAQGIKRSNRLNVVIVSLTLIALGSFVAFGMWELLSTESFASLRMTDGAPEAGARGIPAFLEASALMFVAYTGYGRIATLGEEIRDPKKNIPRAIIVTLAVSMFIYVSVAVVSIGTFGASELAKAADGIAAPLVAAADAMKVPGLSWLVRLGAVTAMLGVLLNLILGLSRVWLAMARRKDAPSGLAQVEAESGSPTRAVWLTGSLVALLTLIGSVEITWSFSAFTVLIYYALTNLSALRLSPTERLYPRWISAMGLASCLGLAFWVDPSVWAAGLVVLALGFVWRAVCQKLSKA